MEDYLWAKLSLVHSGPQPAQGMLGGGAGSSFLSGGGVQPVAGEQSQLLTGSRSALSSAAAGKVGKLSSERGAGQSARSSCWRDQLRSADESIRQRAMVEHPVG